MKRFLVGFLAVIGTMTIVVTIVAGIGGYWALRQFTAEAELPDRVVLTLDLGEDVVEAAASDPLAAFSLERPLEVSELVAALERAAADPRVSGLVARLEATGLGMAVAQEVRAAVAEFRTSGRFAVAWADSFGELGPGNEGYFIATAFDEIQLQPGGMLGLTGLIAEIPFVRPLLDELGIAPEVIRRSDYKTAFDSLVETGLTPANAEMLNDLVDRLYAMLVGAIASGRGMAPERVAALIDDGPFTADAALAAGLVDGLAYRDEVVDRARGRIEGEAELVSVADYARRSQPATGDAAATVALIVAQGAIQRGSAGFDSLIGADDLAQHLEQALDDAAIDAVLLRLDTGGGSAVGSETIGRQVERLRAAGKPIVVSMSNAAASGGYWIAMGASYIVAQPATLTGSIGVIAGKPVLAEAWDRLGVRWASVERGRNVGYLSVNRPLDALARERLERSVDALYERFKAGVAAGRGLSLDEVEALAQGRVWLGEQALGLGLVDELGGLPEARAAVVRLLQLPAGAPIELRRFPPPRSPLERLREVLDQSWVRSFAGVLEVLRALTSPAPLEATLPRFR